jgi:hypothetical protein
MNGNDFIAWVLRSPFHGLLSSGMLLLTVTGRKTQKKYTLPVGYYAAGRCLLILTSRNRTWWRNLNGGAAVDVLLKRKNMHGSAEIELDGKQVELRLADYLKHVPQAAKPMKIRIENNIPNPQDLARTAAERLFVKITLTNETPK